MAWRAASSRLPTPPTRTSAPAKFARVWATRGSAATLARSAATARSSVAAPVSGAGAGLGASGRGASAWQTAAQSAAGVFRFDPRHSTDADSSRPSKRRPSMDAAQAAAPRFSS